MVNDHYAFSATFQEHTVIRGEAFNSQFNALVASFDGIPSLADFAKMNNGALGYGTAGGSVNAYTVTLNPEPTLVDGLRVAFKVPVTNTGASTLNVNGLGVKNLKDYSGDALVAGDLILNQYAEFWYNGTEFRSTTALATDAASASASATAAAVSAAAALVSEGNAATSETNAAASAVLAASSVSSLTTTQMASLTTTQAAAMTTTQLAGLGAMSRKGIGEEIFTALTTTQMASLTTTQSAAMTTTQLSGLGAMSRKGIGESVFASLTSTQVASLGTTQIAELTTTALSGLNSTQINSFTTTAVSGLRGVTVTAIAASTPNYYLGWDGSGNSVAKLGSTATGDMLKADNLSGLANTSTSLTNLGVSTFAKTILDDTDAATVRGTIGAGVGDMLKSDNLSGLANTGTAQTNLGISAYAKTLIDDADAATARATLGVVPGKVLQVQTDIVTAKSTVTADVTDADTAITTTNAPILLTKTITPVSATSRFYIKWQIMGSSSTFRAVTALFDDAIHATNAVRVSGCDLSPSTSDFIGSVSGMYSAASVGTSNRVFSVGVGSLPAGTVYINSDNTGNKDYGATDVSACVLEIWEVES